MLRPLGIKELIRTGRIAIARETTRTGVAAARARVAESLTLARPVAGFCRSAVIMQARFCCQRRVCRPFRARFSCKSPLSRERISSLRVSC